MVEWKGWYVSGSEIFLLCQAAAVLSGKQKIKTQHEPLLETEEGVFEVIGLTVNLKVLKEKK